MGMASSGPSATTTIDLQILEALLREFLPSVCAKHVYRFDFAQTRNEQTQKLACYCKWTFYNDMTVVLHVDINNDDVILFRRVYGNPRPSYNTMRQAMHTREDLVEWQAEAIMRCEAGEDIWERKPAPDLVQSMQNQMNQLSAQQMAAQQQQMMEKYRAAEQRMMEDLINPPLMGLSNIFGKNRGNS